MFTSELISRALAEDIGAGDLTAQALFDASVMGRATMVLKQEGVVAGLGVAGAVFAQLDAHVRVRQDAKDGDLLMPGQQLMMVEGRLRTLLMAERTALNFIQRLSGIATLTQRYVAQTQGSATRILDTRKTTPLLRHLEKYAVRMGGGVNHRMGLYDEMMIKDNHIAALGGDVTRAVELARKAHPHKPLVLEVDQLGHVAKAAELCVDRILLDNMSDEEVRQALNIIAKRKPVEISGGITVERVKRLANMGVDFISVGALTHSAPAADISLDFEVLK